MSTDTIQAPDANDVLMGGGGAPTLKIETQGTVYGGRIVGRPQTKHETEFGKPDVKKYYPSGDPIWSVVVDVQTDQRDQSDPEDTGVRRLYIEGRGKKDAVRAAVQEAGAPGLAQGGELYIVWTGTAAPASAGISGAKLYQARYTPPAAAALNTNGASAPPQPAQQAPQAPAQPTWTPPPPPAAAPPPGPSPEQVAAMKNIGWTDDQIRATYPGWQG